jgi:hypothetical protein
MSPLTIRRDSVADKLGPPLPASTYACCESGSKHRPNALLSENNKSRLAYARSGSLLRSRRRAQP